MYASRRITWPSMAAARLEIPNHDRITRSSRTAPVTGSTFSAPKKCWRAATVGLAACAAAGHAASTAAHAMTPSRFLIGAHENTVDRRPMLHRADIVPAARRVGRRSLQAGGTNARIDACADGRD